MIGEVNGAGSKAVHARDPSYSRREVYAIMSARQRQRRLMRAYPPSN